MKKYIFLIGFLFLCSPVMASASENCNIEEGEEKTFLEVFEDEGLAECVADHLGKGGNDFMRKEEFLEISVLDCKYKKIKEVHSLGCFENLKELSLRNNEITYIKKENFNGLKNLENLDLLKNKIVNIEKESFSSLDNLYELILYGNQISSIEYENFLGLAHLKKLNLKDNQINNIEEGGFTGLRSLEWLVLEENPISCFPQDIYITHVPEIYLPDEIEEKVKKGENIFCESDNNENSLERELLFFGRKFGDYNYTESFSKDNNYLYFGNNSVLEIDGKSFEIFLVDNFPKYAKDKNNVYRIESCAPYADCLRYYPYFQSIEDADSATFTVVTESIDGGTLKNDCDAFDENSCYQDTAKMVYCGGECFLNSFDTCSPTAYTEKYSTLTGETIYESLFIEKIPTDTIYGVEICSIRIVRSSLKRTHEKEISTQYYGGMKKEKVSSPLSKNFTIPLTRSKLFRDVPSSLPFFEAVYYIREKDYVQGFDDGTFRPEDKISRYAFTKIVVNAKYSQEEIQNCDQDEFLTFPDVPKNEWFSPFVCMAKKEGIINGYADGTFGGSKNVTSPEALKIILETYGEDVSQYVSTDKREQWYEKYQKAGKNLGLTKEISDSSEYFITRGEMAEFIFLVEQNDALEKIKVNTNTYSFMDTFGNKIFIDLPYNEFLDISQVTFSEKNHIRETYDALPYITNGILGIKIPQEYSDISMEIKIEYSERPSRVLLFDEDTENLGFAPFDDSEEKYISFRARGSSGQITKDGVIYFALVHELEK